MELKNRDSTKVYGLIGVILIIVAYILWAFVFPALSKHSDQENIDKVIDTPINRQENSGTPITDSPIPAHP
jgi:hypothetical protein